MHITALKLRNIRTIKQCDISLHEGVTAFIGDNGQGKTSLLEAIYIASYMKSFRHVTNDDVISKDNDKATIAIDITDGTRVQDINITLVRIGRGSVFINGQRLRRNRDLFGTLMVSIFTPDDLDIIKGSSSLRRELLDDVLQQISQKYIAVHSDYSRILKQKNAYLKNHEYDKTVLNVLNTTLVASGTQLIRGRLKALSTMREALEKSYSYMAGKDSNVSLRYLSKVFNNEKNDDIEVNESITNDELSELFKDTIDRYSDIESQRAHSIIGPHRDDVELKINGRNTRTQASQGEQRSMALALKMALHNVINITTGDNPILLLDDVFSELDIGRSHRLIECLPSTQTFITSATDIPTTLKVDKTFLVSKGCFSS